jgi:CheY-like chemotaxis protein
MRAASAAKAAVHMTGPAKILVVEDDRTAIQLIESQLTSAGYQVVFCIESERALEIAAQEQPQAITLDLLMKPTSGWEVLLQLKKDTRTANIPVIVVSIVDHPNAGAALGADEYLVKPVDKAALLDAVERCLGRRTETLQVPGILVVEDDTPTRGVIVELLRTRGYRVVVAADGSAARAWVEQIVPELVILDLVLPKVSGFELLTEWRSNPRTADVPVFVLTSKELSAQEQRYLRANAESLFHKHQPWQQFLLSQVQRAVGKTQVPKT